MLLFVADSLACFPYQTQEEPLFIMHHIDITLSVSGSNLLQSFKEVSFVIFLLIFWLCYFIPTRIWCKLSALYLFILCKSLRKGPVQQEKRTNTKKKKKKKKHQSQRKKLSSDEDDDESSSSSSSSDEDVVVKRHKKSAHSDSDSDIADEDDLMERLPENPKPLLDFAGASQGILLLLVLKQHLKNLYGFSDRYFTLKQCRCFF